MATKLIVNFRLRITFYGQPIIVACLFAILSACCPSTSIHPLSQIEQAEYDKRLEGTWVHKSESGGSGYLHIGKADANLTKSIATEIKENGELDYTIFTFFPTFADGQQYLNIKAGELFDDLPSSKASSYILARYKIEDNGILSIFYMDTIQFARAITSGQLKGDIIFGKRIIPKPADKSVGEERTKIDCVQITDTSENILKFLKSNSPDALFPEGIRMERVKFDKNEQMHIKDSN